MKPRALLERIVRPFTRRGGDASSRESSRREEEDLEAIAAREQKAFRYEALEKATRNFAAKQKLGQGGFGPVYRGRLEDGREVAVKRLGAGSRQGAREFKNEATLLSRVQHRNVVNLIGYCAHGADDKLLVYEYVPNESLDKILFSLFLPAAAGHRQALHQQQRRRQASARGPDVAAAARGGGGRGARAAVPARGRAHAHHPPRHQGEQHPPRRPVGPQDRRFRHGPPLPRGRRRPLPRPDPRRRHQRLHGPRVPHARRPLRQGRRLQLRRPRPRDRLRPQELRLQPASRLRRRQPPRIRVEAVQEGAEPGAAGPHREVVGGAGAGDTVRAHRAAVRAGRPAAAAGHEARGDHPVQEAEHARGADAAGGARVAVPAEGLRPAQLAVLRRVDVGNELTVDVHDIARVGVGVERDDDVEHAHHAEPGAPLAPGRAGVAEQQLTLNCTFVHSFFFLFPFRSVWKRKIVLQIFRI